MPSEALAELSDMADHLSIARLISEDVDGDDAPALRIALSRCAAGLWRVIRLETYKQAGAA